MLKEQLPPSENETTPIGRDAKFGDRILIWCLIASIVVNLIFAYAIKFLDPYGTQRVAQEQKQMKLQKYIPPVKQKPKPKPKPKPKKIIPPKPIKIVHQLPKPRPTPHPPPPAPRAPAVGHTSKSPNAVNVGPTTQAPPEAAPQTPGNDTRPQAPISAPPAPTPAVIPPPTPPAPEVKAPPAPEHHAPPPPPPKPKGYVDVESQKASVDSVPAPDMSNIPDPTTINGPCVISYTISTSGRISNVQVKKSSGNSDFDDACKSAVRQSHGVPGVQDHILYEASGEYTFRS